MLQDFLKEMEETLNGEMNVSVTENGAVGYRTTGKNLLDMNYFTASFRSATEEVIAKAFTKAWFDDRIMAVKWLFFARDVRGGMGERRLFRVIIKFLAAQGFDLPLDALLPLIPEYGRYDDWFCLLDTSLGEQVIALIDRQLKQDLQTMEEQKSISLLAKWMPSINASSALSKQRGRFLAERLGMSERQYRKTLSALRGYTDVVERKMSENCFGDIRYEAVPSKANLLYRNAFLRQDAERRKAYLESVSRKETKINAEVLFPHEIVHRYFSGRWVTDALLNGYDDTLEELWKALPDYVQAHANALVVADGSGSMLCEIGGGSCTALSVANALAIYFAERMEEPFANKYITFSENPQLVDLTKGHNLREKLQIALSHNEVANTDIYKVFQLILKTAKRAQLPQTSLPQNIIIISDMEFDGCVLNADAYFFDEIRKEYEQSGYRLPRLVFWNVNSRTRTIPVVQNELGVALVSGFSASIGKMVLSTQLDPYQCLLETLNAERYEPIERILRLQMG